IHQITVAECRGDGYRSRTASTEQRTREEGVSHEHTACNFYARALLECELRLEIMAFHARSQADRTAVPDDHHFLFLPRRRIRHDDSSGADDTAGRSVSGADLQQVVFDARHRNDLPFSDSFDSRRARK